MYCLLIYINVHVYVCFYLANSWPKFPHFVRSFDRATISHQLLLVQLKSEKKLFEYTHACVVYSEMGAFCIDLCVCACMWMCVVFPGIINSTWPLAVSQLWNMSRKTIVRGFVSRHCIISIIHFCIVLFSHSQMCLLNATKIKRGKNSTKSFKHHNIPFLYSLHKKHLKWIDFMRSARRWSEWETARKDRERSNACAARGNKQE